ncbi:4-alpha-glucanotransferase [Tepidibacter formicigenes]|uniref:Uncharacterized protein n=1 Tax=Tepidibacter formicigenes DSM 15518 TaxID=1123349 RepID=A0A1M6LN03_9FIRM|nr:4-alpha-glucanotransferase [Tepidibacter formicigenes]SHJ72547.1 hypothetical protein SAMN02744037_00698 [Tepidibacter formicigenes DSM 15518]
MAARVYEFNITVNYPTKENEEEFDNRAARAVAKILCETLPIDTIDEIIKLYKEKTNK